MDFDAGPSWTCEASWQACRSDDDHLYTACQSQRDCPAPQHCCHVVAAGQRCQEQACAAPGDVVCQTIEDCPILEGRQPVGCPLEQGAYVTATLGHCAYE
jgi:hypothetical protein